MESDSTPSTDPPDQSPLPETGSPWGIWATIGFSFLIAVGFIGASVIVLLAFLAGELSSLDTTGIENLATNGLFFAVSSFASSATAALLVIGCAALRRGITVKEYLDLRLPRWRDYLVWTVLLIVIFVPVEILRTTVFKQPEVPESMLELYRNCSFLPMLWIAVVIGAPIGEEFFFRGFLFEGIRHAGGLRRSKAGTFGAVFLCALLWAVIHLQYNAVNIGVIFLGGLFFGVAKLRSGSLWIPVYLHFVWNLLSMIQMAYVAGQEG